MPSTILKSLYVDESGYLYAGTGDGQVYRTANGGKSWELVSGGLPQSEGIYVVSTTPEGKLLAGLNRKGIYLLK
ncbi:WD40/YVTN/BNR-like repeat-containing protein [Pontibacter mucosus]|uniref:WD40/YVTN/BNR-like repeat-containing protein n=1 Tax=Pontibacter mucosus TaxID=1649266 RepID=UPI000D3D6BAD|nr:hypothetical protein [Pontibacter mucosus]